MRCQTVGGSPASRNRVLAETAVRGLILGPRWLVENARHDAEALCNQAGARRLRRPDAGGALPGDARSRWTTRTPSRSWSRCVLSAQCTDKRVNLVTPELFALADTPEEMAQVPVAEIQRIIRPCGLSPQKAKAISGLSQDPRGEARRPGARDLRGAGGAARGGPQDGERRHGAGLRGAGVSRGHPHPPAGEALAARRRRATSSRPSAT